MKSFRFEEVWIVMHWKFLEGIAFNIVQWFPIGIPY
jgi:hypothetical protein